MNNLLRKYLSAKAYIDDVVVFSKTLNDHLEHFDKVFVLFQKMNITLKTIKTYLEYLTIALLDQKVDNLDLFTIENKLKTIAKMSFSKTLKDLKIYLNATN
jgi:tRNA isopentenyl-2-thiomethyl-A-37 hydroxylase MiaE